MTTTPSTSRILDLCLRIGEVLLSSGAGAADVAAQMNNVAHACGLTSATADVTFTELAMTHQATPDELAVIQIRQVRHRATDYGHLTSVDHLVRDLAAQRIDCEEAHAQLIRIVNSGHSRPRWTVVLGNGVMGAGVATMLVGNLLVPLIAFVSAILIDLVQRRMATRRLPIFYQQVAGGLVATLLVVALYALGLHIQAGRVITASIVLMLAGVSFLGAIQDALSGYPLTAGARILEALLATAGIIAGVSGGLSVADMAGVGLGRFTPGANVLATLAQTAIGAAITAAAYAYANYAPLRVLPAVAVIGAAAGAVYHAGYHHGVGIAWASALAALLVGLVAYAVSGRARVPALIVVVAGIVPLLPGLSIYRGLTLLGAGSSEGLLSMVTAASVAIAVSAGVLLGEYVAQPLKKEARRLETRLSGPRLVGPHRVRSPRPRGRSRNRATPGT